MTSCSFSFILDVTSAAPSQSTTMKQVISPIPPQMAPKVEKAKTTASSQPKALPPISKPTYRNSELERLIATAKTSAKLDLSWKKLTDQDAQVVAYYALIINKVNHHKSTQSDSRANCMYSLHAMESVSKDFSIMDDDGKCTVICFIHFFG